jgi:asparagine synthetase B (glutamine-hydrolysing)
VCGIFAFTGPDAPDPDVLAEAAAGAAQRGPHGYGWAGTGLPAYRRPGRMDIDAVRVLRAPRIIGHARLASYGAAHDNLAGLQPVHADGHLLAHNGNAYNAAELDPAALTDSAALAAVYARHRRLGGLPPAEALKTLIAEADQRAWAIVILDATGVLVAHLHGLPLWRYDNGTGTYLSSRPFRRAIQIPADAAYCEEPG